MNTTPDKKDLQLGVKTETTTTWLDCIVEELDEAAQAAVVGGGGSWKKSDYYYPGDEPQTFG
ncbi:hypothetical protein [Mastigocladopsis repens]|uniref:hypothetical protein n=1 Tax=Mastigocladopsis repens TaxID=221287 RepID=UPI0002FF5DB4|nr:hypothetical protein [Mastigocladopsis repens]